MKTFKRLYPTQPAARRSAFAVSSTATGCAVLLLAASSTAGAADQPAAVAAAAAPLEEVVVTGIRAAIQSAISVKKNANSIVEAISAEDIGKLPDTTIAESLARLPGLTTQRDRDGNATNVSIRGLGPDFNGYLLNGREQTSTGDSRAVDLSVYPAELIGGATVYKSGDAGLMSAGLAGTIDNRLVDPLAYRGLVIVGNVERTKTNVGLKGTDEGTGKRYSLSFIDQFADRKLGIAIGFVHSDTTSSSLANGSWGNSPAVYSDNGVTQIANDGAGPLPEINVPFGGGLSYETDHKTDKRDGGAVILEFKPNDSFTSEADYYYAKIKTGLKKMAVKGATFGGTINNATISGTTVDTGTFQLSPDGLIAYSENIFDDDTIQSLGWKNTLKMSDNWTGSLDYSHNSAKRIEKDIEAYGGVNAADTLSFTNGGGTPQFTPGNPTFYTDPTTIQIRDQSGWSGVQYQAADLPPGDPNVGRTVPQAGYNKGPTVTDKLDAFRLDFTHGFGSGRYTDIQFGVNYTKRSKDRITDEGVIASATNDGYDRITYPAGSYVESNIGGTGLNLLTFDPQVGLWPGAVVIRKYNDDILSKTWTVVEKVTTGYVKLNFDTTSGSTPIRGNFGAQLVNTDQSSGGYRADVNSSVTLSNPAGTLTTDGTKFTDVLPSFNVAADLGDNGLLRLAASIQIARPTLTDMRNSLAVALDTNASNATFGTLVGSSGNPHLKPFKAKAFDVSWEKYFDNNKAYVSAALFYKVLDTYITPATNYGGYDFTQIAANLGLAIPPAGPLGTYTTTVNGSGGNLRGVELAASLPFDLMTSWLEGFGITASYSSTMSSVELPNLIGLNPSQQVPTAGAKMQLPGLSHINEKAMFYYERAGFSAFVADNYRSQYIGSVANSQVGGYPALVLILPQQWISGQIGYEFQSGALKGLGLRFEANNLNKPKYREVQANGSINTNETGAIYALKLHYKFQ